MTYLITSCFVVFDFLTGLIKAFKEKNYNSSIMREGLFHKCGSFLCVVLGVLVDRAQGFVDLGVTLPIAFAICSYICLMEIGSIIENLCAINPRILPKKLQMYFSKLATEEGENIGNES